MLGVVTADPVEEEVAILSRELSELKWFFLRILPLGLGPNLLGVVSWRWALWTAVVIQK